MPDDIFSQIMNSTFLGIPTVFILITLGIAVVLVWKMKPKEEKYKPIDIKKKVKEDLDLQFKYFSQRLRMPIYSGLIKLGMTSGYMPMVWNVTKKRYENVVIPEDKNFNDKLEEMSKEIYSKPFSELEDDKKKAIREAVKYEIREDMAEIEVKGEKVTVKHGKIEHKEIERTDVYVFKILPSNLINRGIDVILGKYKYFIVDLAAVTFNNQAVNLSPSLQRQPYFGQFIFSTATKNIIDNTAFKIERENLLQEVANQIPRTVFFDLGTAKDTTTKREEAKIFEERYKSQQEQHH